MSAVCGSAGGLNAVVVVVVEVPVAADGNQWKAVEFSA